MKTTISNGIPYKRKDSESNRTLTGPPNPPLNPDQAASVQVLNPCQAIALAWLISSAAPGPVTFFR